MLYLQVPSQRVRRTIRAVGIPDGRNVDTSRSSRPFAGLPITFSKLRQTVERLLLFASVIASNDRDSVSEVDGWVMIQARLVDLSIAEAIYPSFGLSLACA
jgi:hypothetical protein